MIDQKTKERIVELRLNGLSIRKISKELNISADTVHRAVRDLREIIDAGLKDQREDLLRQLKIDRQSRLQSLSEMHKFLFDKFVNADWEGLPADRIGKMVLQTIQEIRSENESTRLIADSILSGANKPGVFTKDYYDVDP